MKETFDESLKLLLRHEGGYVDHPKDPGGMTNLGVTRKAWAAYVKKDISAVTEAEMRALTPAAVAPFYYTEYYVKCGADRLPAGLDHAVFDFAVNSGVSRAVKFLQGAVGAAADGVIGPATLAAAGRPGEAASAVRRLCGARLAYLEKLPGWATFGRGWARRVAGVEAEALAMVEAAEKTPPVA